MNTEDMDLFDKVEIKKTYNLRVSRFNEDLRVGLQFEAKYTDDIVYSEEWMDGKFLTDRLSIDGVNIEKDSESKIFEKCNNIESETRNGLILLGGYRRSKETI